MDVMEAVMCLAHGSYYYYYYYYYYYLYTILTVTNAFKDRLPTSYLSVDVCREMWIITVYGTC